MLDPDGTSTTTENTAASDTSTAVDAGAPGKKATKKAPAKKAAKKAPAKKAAAKKEPAKKAAKKAAAEAGESAATGDRGAVMAAPPAAAGVLGVLFQPPAITDPPAGATRRRSADSTDTADSASTADMAAAPPVKKAAAKKAGAKKATKKTAPAKASADSGDAAAPADAIAVSDPDEVREAAVEEATGARRRRRRGRRGRGGGGGGDTANETSASGGAADGGSDEGDDESDENFEDGADGSATGTRRRRRRQRSGTGSGGSGDDRGEDDPPNTVVHVREARQEARQSDDDGVRGVKGSTRLEAKRQRRRDGRDTNRRRPPILTEAEFLARREAVDRVMAVRQTGQRTQIAVLEDGVLVEHYVTRASATSYVGNVYLGRVQNVLPSMEAAFIDIGKGRNGVLYAGEVNWDAAGLEGKSRAIEQALKSGDVVLVQVTKDPIGHKGARLTSQVSLPGRYLVYVPGGGMTGISRRLPDTERHRLKAILKKIVPEDAGVIVRTAAEGASEEELSRDVERLTAQWAAIEKKAEKAKNGSGVPMLVHGEPDLAIRVVRDVFNEDFKRLIVEGEQAWQTVTEYVEGVAPDLAERVSRHTAETDLFHSLRVDEQLMKALDRRVWLPSGGSLVIDRTEAMTVIDVNTGKFIGSGGNLEETVTRNNLEAAEEIVRQLRLRDVGGIVVIDFIDMVLESNRELVLRRLMECLGRDRTKHQVAEVTSLGLVQMTRKRVGEGLLEAFSEPCEVCKGRGVIVHAEPVDIRSSGGGAADEDDRPRAKRKRGGATTAAATRRASAEPTEEELAAAEEQRKARVAAISAIHKAAHHEDGTEILSEGGSEDSVDFEPTEEPAEELAEAQELPAVHTDELEDELADEIEAVVLADVTEMDVPSVPAPRRRRGATRPAGPPVAAAE